MTTIDTHHHFWKWSDMSSRPMAAAVAESVRRDFTPVDLRAEMDYVGVDAVMPVQAADSLDETRRLLAHGRRLSWIAGVVGWVDVFAPDVDDQLAEFDGASAFKGVRYSLFGKHDGMLSDKALRNGLEQLSRRQLTFDVLVRPSQLRAVYNLVYSTPDLRFVLNHMGYPPVGSRTGMMVWRKDLERLASCPNISCKISGFWTGESKGPALRAIHGADAAAGSRAATLASIGEVLDIFGAERCMWASDWPHSIEDVGYATSLKVVRDAVGARGLVAVKAVFGETAARVYSLDVA